MSKPKVKAKKVDLIQDLILNRHAKDVVVPECKTGETSMGMRRMDAWVMKGSWKNPCCTCYEVKVSRSDFLNDEKWRDYLPFCNEFFFVAPKGIVEPNELPEEAGLLLVSKNYKRLTRLKKSVRRDVRIPDSVFRYILMWRCRIGPETSRLAAKEEKVEYWEKFLRVRNEMKWLGYRVRKKINDMVDQRVEKRVGEIAAKNDRLQKENHTLRTVKNFADALGIEVEDETLFQRRRRIEEVMNRVEHGFDKRLLMRAEDAIQSLAVFQKALREELEE